MLPASLVWVSDMKPASIQKMIFQEKVGDAAA